MFREKWIQKYATISDDFNPCRGLKVCSYNDEAGNRSERIGDLAANIAEVAVKRYENQTLVKPLIHIKKMTAVVEKMLEEIIDAYYNKDTETVKRVWNEDNNVDEYYLYIKEK